MRQAEPTQRSTERILTTHAGSLPRPEHLNALYVRRARRENWGSEWNSLDRRQSILL
jgi:hypothetical protein